MNLDSTLAVTNTCPKDGVPLYLIRVHLELLGEIGQGALSSYCGQRDLGFKNW